MKILVTGAEGFVGRNLVETLKTIRDSKDRTRGLDTDIEVDGGINSETALLCKEKGVDILVAGSYILKSEDYKERIDSLL